MRRLRWGTTFAVASVVGLLSTAYAAETTGKGSGFAPVSLLELYAAAKSDNPALRGAMAGVHAAQFGIRDAYFGYLPRASLLANKQRERQNVISTDNPVYQVGKGIFSNKGYTFQALQPIIDVPALARIKGAWAEQRLQRSQLTAADQKMTFDLIEAYILAVAALEDERLAKAEEGAYRDHSKEIRARLDRGMGTSTDLADIEARIAKAHSDWIASHAAVQRALTILQRISTVPVRGLWPLRSSFAMGHPMPSDIENWAESARRANPEVLALLAQSEVADAEMRRMIGELLPRLDIAASDQYLDTGGSLYGGGARTDEQIFEFRLTVPLFNADGRGYPAFAAGERRLQARYAAQDRALDVEQRVRSAFLDAVRDVRAAQSLRTAAANREIVRRDVKKRFQAGVATLTEVVDTERDYVRARRESAAVGYNYLISMMQLKRLTGSIGEDDVRYVDYLLDRKHAYVAVALR